MFSLDEEPFRGRGKQHWTGLDRLVWLAELSQLRA